MSRKIPLILFLSLIFYQAQAQWTFYSDAESFEEKSGTTTDSNGNIVDIYGDIWIEPTTDASISSIVDGKSANYVYSGDKSMKLDGPAGSTNTDYKDRWGALTTEMLDLSGIDRLGVQFQYVVINNCLLYTSPSPRDKRQSRMPSSA